MGGVFPVYNPDTDTLAVGDFADPEWALASDDGQLLLADGAEALVGLIAGAGE